MLIRVTPQDLDEFGGYRGLSFGGGGRFRLVEVGGRFYLAAMGMPSLLGG